MLAVRRFMNAVAPDGENTMKSETSTAAQPQDVSAQVQKLAKEYGQKFAEKEQFFDGIQKTCEGTRMQGLVDRICWDAKYFSIEAYAMLETVEGKTASAISDAISQIPIVELVAENQVKINMWQLFANLPDLSEQERLQISDIANVHDEQVQIYINMYLEMPAALKCILSGEKLGVAK